ncbi:PKD domain-containing protein [uncultured Maribacter sp.]|uniref:PKD domain-containing protein n=1 Tax=uncultured Maribacter sp. TaxID=431308 RepID=UPI00262BAE3C|nr:PKD domain-containing protein [uncultured Maribacter sp.]
MHRFLIKRIGSFNPLQLVCSVQSENRLLGFLFFLLCFNLSMQGQVQISTDPSALSVTADDTFVITVAVQTDQNVDGTEIHMSFDPSILQVSSVNLPEVNPLPVPLIGAGFDNNIGVIDYVAGTFTSFPDSDFDFLEIEFIAIAVGSTNIEFTGLPSKVTFGGVNILSGVTGSTVTVGVIDVIPPIITLIGDPIINLLTGDIYIEQGANAVDDVDGDISENVVIGGDLVDTTIEGEYVITYEVVDGSNNQAVPLERIVVVSNEIINTYAVTTDPGFNGTISPSSTTINQGANIVFTVTPDPGFEIEDVVVNGESVGPVTSYEFIDVQATSSISATFIENSVFQLCIASGNESLTAFGRDFIGDPVAESPIGEAFMRTNGKTYLGYNGEINGTTSTEEKSLFQKEIYGGKDNLNPPLDYEIPVPNGYYQVDLYFAEVYHATPGGRVFDVFLENNNILDEYDLVNPIKDGILTNQTAIVRTYYVEVTDGSLNVQVGPASVDNGKISGLCVTATSETNVHPIASLNNLQFEVGEEVTELLSVQDNDELSIIFNNLPSSLIYNPSNNQLEGTILATELGEYQVNAIITDGVSSPVTAEFTITVFPSGIDLPPSIETIEDIKVSEGLLAQTDIIINDDNEVYNTSIIIYDKSNGGTNNPFLPTTIVPESKYTLTDNGNGNYTLNWNTVSGDGRSYLAEVVTDDGVNQSISQSFNIDIAQTVPGNILAKTFANPLPWYKGASDSAPIAPFTVAIEDNSAQNVGYIDADDFVDYLINVPSSGIYDIEFLAAKGSNGVTTVTILEEDGMDFSAIGSFDILKTAWQTYTSYSTSVEFAKSGLQTIRLEFNSGANLKNFIISQSQIASCNVAFRINTGGPIIGQTGGEFEADQSNADVGGTAVVGTPSPYYKGAIDKTFGSNAALVSNATGYPDAIFQTERHIEGGSLMNWEFPANGIYEVNLLFNENWTGEANNPRVFDVEIEGGLVLDDYRPSVAAGGVNIAKVETFTVEVSDGIMNIDFIQGTQNPSIKGFSICLVSESVNTPPIVSIVSPSNELSVIRGMDVDLLGTAIDTEDGDISNLINWNSNDTRFTTTPLNGIGSNITAQFVSPGVQTLTATAIDSDSETGNDEIIVNVSGPEVAIDLPLQSSELNSTSVRLEWTGTNVLYELTEHYHLFVNPSDINNIDSVTRISTASQIGQEFWDLTELDGIVEGANTIVVVVADPTHAEFINTEAKDIVNFNITLQDNTSPIITLLDDDPLLVELGSPYNNLGASAFDEVDQDLTGEIIVGGDFVDVNTIGDYLITYNVSDAAGNLAIEVTQIVTVADNVAPIITCPIDVVVSTDVDVCGAILSITDPSAIDISNTITYEGLRSDSLPLTEPFSLGETTIIWTATDESGNISQPCIQTITVNDEVGPNLDCPINISTTSLNGNPIVIDIISPIVFDSCSDQNVVLTSTRNDGLDIEDAFPVGTTQIEWKAFDEVGNFTSCIQSITVNFTASVQNDITSFSVTGQEGSGIIDDSANAVLLTVVAGTDVSTLTPVIGVSAEASINPNSGVERDFTNPVNYTVTAQDGTEKIWTVIVTVQDDNENPEISCPNDISISNETGQCGALVNYTLPVGIDNVPGAITVLTEGLGNGAFFPIGTSTEVYTVTDLSGNSTSCSFDIVVLDTESPLINCPEDIIVKVEEGIVNAVVEYASPFAEDNCSSVILQQISGFTSGSLFPLGTTVNTFEATDEDGNKQTCSFNVVIENNYADLLSIVDFTLVNADTDQDIMTLTDGLLINSTSYENINLAIRVNATIDVGSVQLLLSGSKSKNQSESVTPFSLFGDNASTGDYAGELFPIGSYSLTATPYSNTGLSGDLGTTKTIDFQFIDENPLCVNFEVNVSEAINPSSCSDNDGSITINTVGFEGSITYNWSHDNNLNTATAIGLGADTYNVTIIDSNGCSENLSITLNDPELPIVTLEPFSNVLLSDSPFILTGGSPLGGEYIVDGVNSNTFNPSIGVGEYIITYTYTDENGCSNSSINSIIVSNTPITDATLYILNADDDSELYALTDGLEIIKSDIGNMPLGIIYNADLNPGNVTFKLTGPVNQTKSEGPSAPYSLFGDIGVDIQGKVFPVGNYTLVTTTSSGMSETVNFSVVSGPPANVAPLVSLTGDVDGTEPFKVNFSSAGSSDNDGSIVDYSWNFGDGDTSNEQDPSHTYVTGGSYNVTLTLIDDDGATAVNGITVTAIDPTVNQLPNAMASASPSSGTAPLTVEFSSSGSNDGDGFITLYEWDFGDGSTSTEMNPSHTYANVGNYIITLTVTDNDGAENTDSVNITVSAPVDNSTLFILNADDDSELYALTDGLEIIKSDIGNMPLGIIYNADLNPGNVTFKLTGPVNQTKSEGPSAPYSLFGDIGVDIQGKVFPVGNYTLVTTTSSGMSETVNFSVVSGPPANVAPLVSLTGDVDGTEPFKVNFSSAGSSDNDGSIVDYSWNFGDGDTSNEQDPSHTYVTGGSYNVTLTLTDDDGATAVNGITVTAIDITEVDKVVSFTLINTVNQLEIFNIENNMNISDANDVNIRANTYPSIVGSVKFELSGALSRTWVETNAPYALYGDFDGQFIPANFPIGSYTLKATPYTNAGASGETGQSLTVKFNVVQAISTAKTIEKSMNVYPNPATESITLSFDEPTNLTLIYIYDITGRLIKTLSIDASQDVGNYLIGIQDLPAGSYFIRTIDSEGKESQQQLAIKR